MHLQIHSLDTYTYICMYVHIGLYTYMYMRVGRPGGPYIYSVFACFVTKITVVV